MSKLSQLKPILAQLAVDAANLDRARGEHHQPLFDERLFHAHCKLLVPCVKEAQSTFDTILREEQANKLTQQRAEFLSERLLAQISAIQRELSTQSIRKNEPKHSSYYRKPINALYQELAQHQEWETRLKDMVREKEFAVSQASSFQQQQAQQALIATEQRLKRCQEAKLKIENQITYREKNQ
ncbi:primosomal replication protein [Vibrio sp. SCSIO 43135]|uniref:Primosomal replication protein n=1 Tax=Vibrio paucivorans TaxID=2829489 RepID=A0A9X3CHF5_9VIBR|nr:MULTISPECIES: primosomal replication protein [Vibrio]MCW8334820.1 primosomal replication protein [Vibrio paucivorans]USD40213.1 primosomal replication protein [Vibrio sp. SCSIO 43135]